MNYIALYIVISYDGIITRAAFDGRILTADKIIARYARVVCALDADNGVVAVGITLFDRARSDLNAIGRIKAEDHIIAAVERYVIESVIDGIRLVGTADERVVGDNQDDRLHRAG